MQAVRLVPAVQVGAGQAAKRGELVPWAGGLEDLLIVRHCPAGKGWSTGTGNAVSSLPLIHR